MPISARLFESTPILVQARILLLSTARSNPTLIGIDDGYPAYHASNNYGVLAAQARIFHFF